MSSRITNNQRETLAAIDSVSNSPFYVKGNSSNGALNVLLTNDVFALSGNITQIAGNAIATAASGIMKVGLTDGTGNAITSTTNALDINIKSGNITGYATSAKQDTGNTSLASIDTKTPALGQALAAGSVPVVLTASQLSTLTPLSTIAATQSGTWNITNISGTVSLPTGAATSALQTTGNTSLSSIEGKLVTQITADYDTGAGTQNMQMVGVALPASGGAVAGGTATNPIQVSLANTGANATAVKVDGSAVTQPVSGTVTANAGTGTFTISGAVTQSGNWTTRTVGNAGAVLDGVNTAATAPANGLLTLGIYNSTEPSPTTGQSVGVQLDSKGRTRTVLMDAAGNTRGANVTASNAILVDLSATTANSTAVKVDGSAVTQPISNAALTTADLDTGAGTDTRGVAGIALGKSGGALILSSGSQTSANSLPVVIASDQAALAVSQSGAWSVTANAGTNLNTSALALESGGNLATIAGAVKAEDAASADLDKGIPAMAVRKATPANTSGTDGDYEMLQISAGRLWASATIDAALPAGTNAIGKLAANDGVDIGDVTINNAAGASAVNIQDGGNSITVDGSVSVSGTTTTKESQPSTSAVTSVASSATSVSLLASNASRRQATFYNDSTQVLYLKLGATASSTSHTVQMAAGSYYELPQPVYTGAIDGIWAAANGNARITELT